MSRQSLPRLTPLFGLKRMSGGTLQWRCRAIACAAYFLMYCASAFGTSSSPSSPSEKMRVPSGGSAWSEAGRAVLARSTARFPWLLACHQLMEHAARRRRRPCVHEIEQLACIAHSLQLVANHLADGRRARLLRRLALLAAPAAFLAWPPRPA